MQSQSQITRREGFVHLCELCQALASSLHNKHLPPDQVFVTFHKLIALECVECKAKVTGEELFVFSGDITIGGRRLKAGDYLYTPPGAAHDAVAHEETVLFMNLPKPPVFL